MHQSEKEERLSLGVALDGDGEQNPCERAIFAYVALFEARVGDLTADQTHGSALARVPIFRRRDLLEAGTHQLLRRVPDDSREALVALQDLPFERGVQDADRRLIERGAIAFLVVVQPRTGLRPADPAALAAAGAGISVRGGTHRFFLGGWNCFPP